jgi:C-8 sterol isomerase
MGYLFDPAVIHEVGRKGVGLPPEQMVKTVMSELHAAYPGHVATEEKFIFSMAAGITGIMTVLHGSLSEYIVLFGTPVGSEGFSGRYGLDIYDVVLSGEMWTYTEESYLRRDVFKPGDMAALKKGQAKGVKLHEDVWLLEYGRGFVPGCLPLGLADALISCLDPITVGKTLAHYGKLVVRELAQGKI